MKRLLVPMIAVLGFLVGWNLPKSEPPATAVSSVPVSGQGPRRELRKRALMEALLSDEEREACRMRSASIAGIVVSMQEKRHMQEGGGNEVDEEVARLMELGPAAAMDAMLGNPVTDPDYIVSLAAAWARKQPGEAIRYLRGRKQSYVVGDCLKAVLEDQAVREEEKQQEQAQSASEATTSFETEEKEEPHIEQASEPPSPKKSVTWDPATYDGDNYEQQQAMREDLQKHPEETVARIAATGSRALRGEALEAIVDGFPRDAKEWPEATRRLETSIQQLGLIPEDPPRGFEIGPEALEGSQVSAWVDRQPLALRRAWSPGIVDRWTQVDPQAAMKWASTLPEDASRDQAIQTGVIVWTHRDPSGAIAYVDALPAGDIREVAISNAAASWNCIDPTAARRWLDQLPDSPGKQRALERLKQ